MKQCCGSGIRCLFDPWIRDGWKVRIRIRIRDEQSGSYFLELRNHFLVLKDLNSLMRNRDMVWKKFESGMKKSPIRDKHSGSATLLWIKIQMDYGRGNWLKIRQNMKIRQAEPIAKHMKVVGKVPPVPPTEEMERNNKPVRMLSANMYKVCCTLCNLFFYMYSMNYFGPLVRSTDSDPPIGKQQ